MGTSEWSPDARDQSRRRGATPLYGSHHSLHFAALANLQTVPRTSQTVPCSVPSHPRFRDENTEAEKGYKSGRELTYNSKDSFPVVSHISLTDLYLKNKNL